MRKIILFIAIVTAVHAAGCRQDQGALTPVPDRQETGALTPEGEGPGGIRVGMTRAQVMEAMLDEVRKLQMSGQVTNPYSTEIRQGTDGVMYEVMFYYTGLERGDNMVSDEELIPVVLTDGQVVGWGWGYLGEVIGNR